MRLNNIITLATLGIMSLTACQADVRAEGLRSDSNFSYIAQISRDNETVNVPLIAYYGGVDEQHYEWSCTFKSQSEQDLSYYSLSSSLKGKTINEIIIIDEHSAYLVLSGEVSDKSATRGEIYVSPKAFSSFASDSKGATEVCKIYIGETTGRVERQYETISL